MLSEPQLTHRIEDDRQVPLLVWRLAAPALAISSAVLGGGIGPCAWMVNATVPMSYDRPDPAAHLAEIAAGLDLRGPGVGLMTGVDVADVVSAEQDGVRLWATVGLGAPIQAAPASCGDSRHQGRPESPHEGGHVGTINVVAWVPERLSAAALVNAVATITEAKTQAVRDLGLAATGTATDAVCVVCPPSGPVAEYGGPRSRWGEPLARATHRAVLAGGEVNLSGIQSWSERAGLSGR
nr:adenosylcobinamide amidohydrolase [uncultured Actinoplanes sp.]